MQRSRRAILDILKQRQRASLDELAHELGLATMTVRGHLSVLERDGLVSFEEERGRVGRPRFVYSLTERGNEVFPKSYDVLCNRILDVLSVSPHLSTPSELAAHIARRWADDYAELVEGKPLDEKVEVLAAIRTEEGAMATAEKTTEGYLLHQHHCPASCVAARHPDIICAAELGFMRRLLGVSIERLSWMARGDSTCTYRIRSSEATSSSLPSRRPIEQPDPEARPAIPD